MEPFTMTRTNMEKSHVEIQQDKILTKLDTLKVNIAAAIQVNNQQARTLFELDKLTDKIINDVKNL
jgi:hypothetical protein